ncbi:TonB-dependent receptor [Pseudoflavitalea sp. G-6-1-2]|uniref:TonB-dependent receptor n=1 Tax=Pseudoflavitalea sp. G-6-1-2 TaxID=2728841 RepID=UPI00146F894E|nr:TonB-dependent receptor [Pseudoflavitalea sp. G-6-1-2]NML19410.1 TonB-dependent receptor [Pseudoflavitalea sp. G-6-1-2]
MGKKIKMLFVSLLMLQQLWAQQGATIKGKVQNAQGKPVSGASIIVEGMHKGSKANQEGAYLITALAPGTYQLRISAIGFSSQEKQLSIGEDSTIVLDITLTESSNEMEAVEVFGQRNKQPQKLDALTRLPLKPGDQIQSISVISDKLISQQGNLTVIEATRNVPGVYTYARYGGASESISSRGFRGIPILKNGVRMHTDFRGFGFITDLQSVENIQVLKGSSAVTMGAATDLGGPGGIINVVTKTPKFVNSGMVSLRANTFNQVRPVFDVQGVLDNRNTIAFRINGGYERSGDYHDVKNVGVEKFFINPSLEWRPDEKTAITVEMDYLDDSRTKDVGTVNLAPGNKYNDIYKLPKGRFLGFSSDRANTINSNYAVRFRRELNEKLYLRGSYYYSAFTNEGIRASLSALKSDTPNNINVSQLNLQRRSLGHDGYRNDKNSVVQFDLVGQNVYTGKIKHTFMVGVDYRTSKVNMKNYNSFVVDTIDVFKPINNKLNKTYNFTPSGETNTTDRSTGVTVQDVIQVNKWLRLFGSVRFTTTESRTELNANAIRESYWNPLAGVMFTVNKNINLFASYTNSTNPRTAQYVDINGNELGNERIDQIEAGFKSQWLNDRLRFNLTVFQINNRNQNIQAAVLNPSTGVIELKNYYFKGGNDERKGVEVEITGRVLENLELIAGYAYIDAQYKEHTTFVPGSAPNNTPTHTFNAWASYTIREGALRNLNLSAGVYYLGDRPYNDWTQANTNFHGIQPNTKPWKNKAYTIVNAQVGYEINKNWGVRVFGNNIFNAVGFDAYRTSYIDQIDPANVAAAVIYKF